MSQKIGRIARVAATAALFASVPTPSHAFAGERLVRKHAPLIAVSGDGSKVIVYDYTLMDRALVETKVGGRVTRLSKVTNDAQFTADGKRVVFSTTEKLVPTDSNGAIDVYSYDPATKVYRNLTASFRARTSGWEVSQLRSIDADASRIAVQAGNERTAGYRVAIWDVPTQTARFPDSRIGVPASNQSSSIALSADGNIAVWSSRAPAVGGPLYRYQWSTNAARMVSKTAVGGAIPGGTSGAAISPDGRFALFAAKGAGIVGTGTPVGFALYRVDMTLNRTARIADRIAANSPLSIGPGGKYVAYVRLLSTTQQPSNAPLGFVRNLSTGAVLDLGQPNAPVKANGSSQGALLASNGRAVVFHSFATNFGVTIADAGPGSTFIAPLP